MKKIAGVLKRRAWTLIICLVIVSLLFRGITSLAAAIKDSGIPVREALRDTAVVVAAEMLQAHRPDIKSDYTRTQIVADWGAQSNSQWLLDMTRLIVPYFYYENISPIPVYPLLVAYVPMEMENAFHLAGRTDCRSTVIINEKFALLDRWESADALSVLVHELIHIQGSAFCGVDDILDEVMTQVATLEVLAGMCNHSIPLACDAFWGEFQYFAAMSLRLELMRANIDQLYQRFADIVIRTPQERSHAAKSLRYWQQDPYLMRRMESIISTYAVYPWRKYTLENLCGGEIDTGMYSYVEKEGKVIKTKVTFKLDDTAYLVKKYVPWLMWNNCQK